MPQYFTRETDKALVRFIESETQEQKHEIFQKEIRPAFEKLIENLIFVYGFYGIDDVSTLKDECLSVLYEMIPKYDPSKGSKGFSYFNVIAKNWFIYKTRERNKKNKLESELYYDLDHEVARNDRNLVVSPHEDEVQEREWWLKFYEEMDNWRPRLVKKTEKQVLEAIIFLFRNPDLVSIYNKKAVFLYLRELTGLNSKQVVTNIKKVKALYDEWYERYSSDGESDDGPGEGDQGER